MIEYSDRRLTYKFLELPHVLKLKAISCCNLACKNDDKLDEQTRWIEMFKRAKERGQLMDLWEVVCQLAEK